MDLLLTVPAIALVAPVVGLLALAVKLDSRGPAFYAQVRVGKGGRPFRILKFRSMIVDAESVGPAISGRRDPRVTRFGALLRATKLDELPQLINVLKGEMTLIGPRAEVPRYIPHFTPEERSILDVRPGLTGPGQIFFTTDQAQELDAAADPDAHYIGTQLHPKLALDLQYLRRRSPGVDAAVLARTVLLMLGFRR